MSRQQLKYTNMKYGFNDYLMFLPVFVLETFALFKLIISYIDLCSQMSSGFFCRNFLKLTPKFLSLSISHMRDINEFLNSLCHRRCWLSRTFYKPKYLQLYLEKRYFLRLPVTKVRHTSHVACPFTRHL